MAYILFAQLGHFEMCLQEILKILLLLIIFIVGLHPVCLISQSVVSGSIASRIIYSAGDFSSWLPMSQEKQKHCERQNGQDLQPIQFGQLRLESYINMYFVLLI